MLGLWGWGLCAEKNVLVALMGEGPERGRDILVGREKK